MARTSKKTEVKATETAIASKAEDIKTEDKAAESKAAAAKTAEATETKAKTTKKTAEKAAAPKAEETKAAEKKEAAKSKAAPKKAELTSSLSIQYGGKELSMEDLVKTAKEIWKNDLKQKAGDLSSVELYLKPEENKVYYVMNKDVTGSFDI